MEKWCIPAWTQGSLFFRSTASGSDPGGADWFEQAILNRFRAPFRRANRSH